MQIRGKFLGSLVALAVLALAPTGYLDAVERDDIRPWTGDLPVRGPWLRDHMPDGALLYLRVPHPLGFLATPKGNAMDRALRSTGNVENLMKIQSALVANVLEYLPGFQEAYVREFAEQLRSPFELALQLAPAPSVIVAMNVDIDSDQEFAEAVANIVVAGIPLSLLEPLDDGGFGQIMGLPVPAAIHFDADTGQMLMQAGPAVSAELFDTMVMTMADMSGHKMHAMERQIDSSGHGWYFWIDTETAIPAAQMFMDPEQLAALRESGLDKVRALATGWGVANNKGRLSIIADMPRDGERRFLPYVRNDIAARSVGEPDAVIVLSIPTAEEFSRIEALVLETAGDGSRDEWLEMKARMEEASGIRIEDVLNAIGPEFIAIFDAAGDYVAIRLRNAELFDRFIENVSAFSGIAPIERTYKRHTFYHWAISTELQTVDQTEFEDESFGTFAFLMSRQKEHVHWYRDGDFLYMASVPQPLVDRIDARADTDIADWLAERQNMDLSNSLLAATGSSDKLPRRIYHVYIEMLQAISDIAEAEFDVWSMPSANQVDLPDEGSLGFSVNLGDPYLSMELMFENNPLESLFSGDMTSVAAAGVLAAIAIPAYQDYTTRAKVSQGLESSALAKAAIAEYHAANGAFPGPAAAAEITDQFIPAVHVLSVEVVAGSGIIVLTFTEDALPDGGQLFLVPAVNVDGSLDWECSATIAEKHIPATCRNSEPPLLENQGI